MPGLKRFLHEHECRLLRSAQAHQERRPARVPNWDFRGWLGGASGPERDREIPFKSDHVGIRLYRIVLSSDLKPGQYAFFMGTGQQSATAGSMAGMGAGEAATGRV